MDIPNDVTRLFNHSIASFMEATETLAHPIATASELLANCMLKEGKILCCGEGQSLLITQHFAANLLNRFHYDRPSLPAISLGSDSATLTAISNDNSYSEIYAKQIQALGQPGDVLLLCYQGSGSSAMLRAIQAAHERQLHVVTLHNQDGGDIHSLLTPDDVELYIPASDRARVTEIQLLTVHCLCELIDQQLFGDGV